MTTKQKAMAGVYRELDAERLGDLRNLVSRCRAPIESLSFVDERSYSGPIFTVGDMRALLFDIDSALRRF